tara:strand:- start:51 stop:200 length:150 start_codon:yes stop_codon:yes gene_type:complete
VSEEKKRRNFEKKTLTSPNLKTLASRPSIRFGGRQVEPLFEKFGGIQRV